MKARLVQKEWTMPMISRGTITALFAFLIATTALAQRQDVEGGKDHPLMSRYPGSVITEYDQKEYDEFEFPVGPGGRDNPGKLQHLEGKVTHIVYENPQGRSVLEVYRNIEGALRNAQFGTVYTCATVQQCGWGSFKLSPRRSTDWNDAGEAHHLSAKLSRPQGDAYVSLVVQSSGASGSQTTLDIIETKPMETGLVAVNAESLAGDLSRTGHASVYGIYFDTGKADVKPESDAALKEISKLLQQQPKLKLYVVGHTDNQGTLDSNMELSRRRAAAVAVVLTSKYGVAGPRLIAQGDGPTAPVASNDTEDGRAKNRRVELVKQ